ncbi:MAG: TrmH family RNA methyltransferase [Candidatus Latescibacterota bacterium]|jgi:TrmH family RNA methyltransferase
MAIKGARHILALKQRKSRDEQGKYLIEGIRLCEEAIASHAPIEQFLFCRESIDRNERLATLFQNTVQNKIPIQQTDWRAFKGMSDTETPQGVLGVVNMPKWNRDTVLQSTKPILILDRISDPGNLGMIMRTAEAASCAGIFLTPGSVELFNAKVVRSTMGAIFRLPVFSGENGLDLIQELTQHNISILAAHIDGTPYHQLTQKTPVALLLGNEAFGVDPELLARATQTVTIPMTLPVESLNVAVASGILLYKLYELSL